jgi:hypothetical protein
MFRTSISSKVRCITNLLLLGFTSHVLAGSALAQDVSVGTCRLDLPHYDNLDDAVHGVPVGGTIGVCPGIYAEQVNINASLTLMGIQDGNKGLPVVVPPVGGLKQNATGYNVGGSFYRNAALAAQILVNPGATVNISNIALDASNSLLTDCSPQPIGILYSDASGDVNQVAVRNQITPCKFNDGTPNPQGDGVFVQSDGALPAVVTVENSSFHNIGLNTIDAVGAAASLTANGNTVVGPGNTQGNGIYTAHASLSASYNAISNALHTGEGTAFFGIVSECAPSSINNNSVSNSFDGIDVFNPSACGVVPASFSIANNQTFDSTNGIEVCGPGGTIQYNTINDSAQAGVALDQGCGGNGSTVSSNTINGACAAVMQGPDNVGDLIGPNNIFNSKFLLVVGTSCQ